MTNSVEKMAGSKKVTKYCEFCGKELEQLTWGNKFYVPAYHSCECEESKKAKIEAEKLKLQKEKEENIKLLYEKSFMSKRARNCTFDNYQLNFFNQETQKICFKYAENFDIIKNKSRNGLFIAGECGVGKSHIAYAIANALIQKEKKVICTSMIDFLTELRSNFQGSGTEIETLAKYENCALLVLDDLGKEKPTEWALQMIYSIVDHRYNSLKPIIVTTNYTADELVKRFTVGSDNKTASAIIDRLFEMCQYVPLKGESFRKR